MSCDDFHFNSSSPTADLTRNKKHTQQHSKQTKVGKLFPTLFFLRFFTHRREPSSSEQAQQLVMFGKYFKTLLILFFHSDFQLFFFSAAVDTDKLCRYFSSRSGRVFLFSSFQFSASLAPIVCLHAHRRLMNFSPQSEKSEKISRHLEIWASVRFHLS